MMFSLLAVVLAFSGLRVAKAQEDCINILPDRVASLSNDTFNFVAGIVQSIEAPDLSSFANQSALVLDTVLPGASTLGDIQMMIGGVLEGASVNFPMVDPASFTGVLTGAVTTLNQLCIEDIPMEAGMLVEQLMELIPTQMELQAGADAVVAAVAETFSDAASLLSIENALKSLNMTVTGFGLPAVPEIPQALTNEGIMQNLQVVMGAVEGLLNQTMTAVQDIVGEFTTFVAGATEGLPTISEARTAIVESVEDVLNQTTEAVQDIVETTTDFVEDLPYVPEARAAIEEGVERATERGEEFIEGVQGAINETTEAVSDFVEELPTAADARAALEGGVQDAIDQATEAGAAVVEGVQGAVNQTTEAVSDFVEQIPYVPETIAAIEEGVQGAVTQATETGAAVVEGVQGAINETTQAASEAIEGVSNFVEGILPPLPEQIPTISEASQILTESIESTIEAAGGALNQTGVTDAVNTLMEGIMEFVASLGSESG